MIGREHVPNMKAELFAGGGVFVVEDPGAPEQDAMLFHDNAIRSHE